MRLPLKWGVVCRTCVGIICTDKYLDWNSNHPISAKRSVVQALMHRAKMVCSTSELLAKEMDYLNIVLCLNSYPDWFLKKSYNNQHAEQTPSHETSKVAFVSVPYIQGLSEEFRRIFKNTEVQIIFKGCNTLKTLLMHPNNKIPAQLCQDVVYQWICPTENCSSTYIGESSRCLESRVKEHSTSTAQYFNTTKPAIIPGRHITVKNPGPRQNTGFQRCQRGNTHKNKHSCTQPQYR